MNNDYKENNSTCFFCNSKDSLFKITNEVNDILFKMNYSNFQSLIYYNLQVILFNLENKDEKFIYMCHCCLTKSMDFHYFGIDKFKIGFNYDFISNSKTAIISFLQLIENYKILSRKILEINLEIFRNIQNLFNFINSHTKIFYEKFGNNSNMIIKQICSLIGFLREMINLNSNSNHLEDNFLNDIKYYIEKMFEKIAFYQIMNNPNFEFNYQFSYSSFLNFLSVQNYNINVEKNKQILKELTKDNNLSN